MTQPPEIWVEIGSMVLIDLQTLLEWVCFGLVQLVHGQSVDVQSTDDHMIRTSGGEFGWAQCAAVLWQHTALQDWWADVNRQTDWPMTWLFISLLQQQKAWEDPLCSAAPQCAFLWYHMLLLRHSLKPLSFLLLLSKYRVGHVAYTCMYNVSHMESGLY